MKTCSVCRVEKPLDEFHKAAKTKDGRQYRCKLCSGAAAVQWKKDNPERAAEIAKRHQESALYRARRKARREGPARERILLQKRESYAKHQDEQREKMRARRGDPEKLAAQRARVAKYIETHPRGLFESRLRRTYKTTLAEFDAMLIEQTARCAVCSKIMVEPCVDHDHTLGHVRGLLCHECNRGLGLFYDNADVLRAAADYLDRTKI